MVPIQVAACVQLFSGSWTVVLQAPLSMGFPRQEYWSGLLFPPPKDRPDPGIEPTSPALARGFFTTMPPGKPIQVTRCKLLLLLCSHQVRSLCGPMDCSAPDFLVPHHLLEFAQADLTYLQKRCIPLKCNNNHNKICCYVTHLFTISQVNCLKMDRASLNSDPKWIAPLPGS